MIAENLTEASCHPKAETRGLAWLSHLGSHRGWGCHGMPVLSEVAKHHDEFWMTGHNKLDTNPGMPCLGRSGKAAGGNFRDSENFQPMRYENRGSHC